MQLELPHNVLVNILHMYCFPVVTVGFQLPAAYSVTESDVSVNITIVKQGSTTAIITVNFTTVSGTAMGKLALVAGVLAGQHYLSCRLDRQQLLETLLQLRYRLLSSPVKVRGPSLFNLSMMPRSSLQSHLLGYSRY